MSVPLGLPLVIDVGFESLMRSMDVSNLADQLAQAFDNNREARTEPFHVVLANFSAQSLLSRFLCSKKFQFDPGIPPLNKTESPALFLRLYPF